MHSPEFPARGRIDYLEDIEVDMSPEDLYTHGTAKAEIGARLHLLVTDEDRGAVFVDRARITHPGARLSVAPDVATVLSREFRLLRRPAAGHRWGYRLDYRPLTR